MQAISASLSQAGEPDPSASDRKVWTIVAFVMLGLAILLFLFTLVMIRRLKIAIACLKVRMSAFGETDPKIQGLACAWVAHSTHSLPFLAHSLPCHPMACPQCLPHVVVLQTQHDDACHD